MTEKICPGQRFRVANKTWVGWFLARVFRLHAFGRCSAWIFKERIGFGFTRTLSHLAGDSQKYIRCGNCHSFGLLYAQCVLSVLLHGFERTGERWPFEPPPHLSIRLCWSVHLYPSGFPDPSRDLIRRMWDAARLGLFCGNNRKIRFMIGDCDHRLFALPGMLTIWVMDHLPFGFYCTCHVHQSQYWTKQETHYKKCRSTSQYTACADSGRNCDLIVRNNVPA